MLNIEPDRRSQNEWLTEKLSADKVQSCVFIIPHNQFDWPFLFQWASPV